MLVKLPHESVNMAAKLAHKSVQSFQKLAHEIAKIVENSLMKLYSTW